MQPDAGLYPGPTATIGSSGARYRGAPREEVGQVAVAPVQGQEPRTGSFPDGMDYVTWGAGPRTLLLIPVGPGSAVPEGRMLAMLQRQYRPLVDAGFAVWVVTRRRHMPPGHSLADMADDYARLVSEQFGGRVDLVVGESFGGMVAQHLAAAHPRSLDRLVLVAAGCEASPWGKVVDGRLAAAAARGDFTGAGTAFAEYLLPGRRLRWMRRLLGRPFGKVLADQGVPPEDYLTELRAEESCDSRPVLGRITVPVLLLAGTRDRFFPRDVVEETARLIPDCTVVWYRGHGHLRAATSKRIPGDVLGFVGAAPQP